MDRSCAPARGIPARKTNYDLADLLINVCKEKFQRHGPLQAGIIARSSFYQYKVVIYD